MSSSALQVKLEPFNAASAPASRSSFLPSAMQRDASSGEMSVTWKTQPMDTSGSGSGSGGSGSRSHTPSVSPALRSEESKEGSSTGGGKDKEKEKEKDGGSAAGVKDAKYLDNFLSSIGHLPELVREKVGRIKGLEKALALKSAALKDASAFHVQMIHAKLTPPAKKAATAGGAAGSNAAGTGTGTGAGTGSITTSDDALMPPPALPTPPAATATSASAMGSSTTSAASSGHMGSFASPPFSSTSLNPDLMPLSTLAGSSGGGSGSGKGKPPSGAAASSSSSGSSSSDVAGSAQWMGGGVGAGPSVPLLSQLPPLPVPSPLTTPLPFTLTPTVLAPLPTENLLNNLTYLLVGPVQMHAHAAANAAAASGGGGSATGGNVTTSTSSALPSSTQHGTAPSSASSSSSAAASSSSASSHTSVAPLLTPARLESGSLPMHLSPHALSALSGKKVSQQSLAAQSHPFASVPSVVELNAAAVPPAHVEPPAPAAAGGVPLGNEQLDLARLYPTPEQYDLDAVETVLRAHQAQLAQWHTEKASLVAELAEVVEALQKRAEISLKKYESKLRRGAFEVPATPIDRRRGPGAVGGAAGALPPPPPPPPPSSASSSSTAAAASSSSSSDLSRKRSYTSFVHDQESRELTFQLQHELRTEIEKQSTSAIQAARESSAAAAAGGAGGSGGGAAGAAGGGAGGAGVTGGLEAEPVYCICKKVSFGAMVACDNTECPTEWFHFACVGLDTKPRGKWLCADCRNATKKKKKTAGSSSSASTGAGSGTAGGSGASSTATTGKEDKEKDRDKEKEGTEKEKPDKEKEKSKK